LNRKPNPKPKLNQPEDVAAVPIVMIPPLTCRRDIVEVLLCRTWPLSWFVQGRGGWFVAKDMVLTAAHCKGSLVMLLNSLTAYDDIRAGRASKPVNEPSVARFSNISRIQVPHPDYNSNSNQRLHAYIEIAGRSPSN
jgi:hypothetical protein